MTTGRLRDVPPRSFWLALGTGVAMIAFGVRSLLAATDPDGLESAVRWFVAGNLVHDLVVAPVACLAGFAVARLTPPRARGPVQAALVACGIFGVVAYPFVRGYGVTAGEPSFLDRDYLASLLVLWALTWAVALGVIVARRPPRPRSPTATATPEPRRGRP